MLCKYKTIYVNIQINIKFYYLQILQKIITILLGYKPGIPYLCIVIRLTGWANTLEEYTPPYVNIFWTRLKHKKMDTPFRKYPFRIPH